MRKILLLWIGLLCVCISCQRVEFKKKCDAHSPEYNLRGEVKKIETIRVEGADQDTTITFFNSHGNIELIVPYNGMRNLWGFYFRGSWWQKWEVNDPIYYIYDKDDRLISERYLNSRGDSIILKGGKKYIRVNDTLIIVEDPERKSDEDSHDRRIYYDKNGNKIGEEIGEENDDWKTVYKYEYDSINRIVRKKVLEKKPNLDDDDFFVVIECNCRNEFGDVSIADSYLQDVDGEWCSDRGREIETYEYEYDKFNNWVGRLVYYDVKERPDFRVEKNGKYYLLFPDEPVVLRYVYYEKRTITYYNGETTQASEDFIKNAEIKYQESENNRNAYLEKLEKETIKTKSAYLEQRIKKEQEEELRRLAEKQPIQLIETIRHGFSINNGEISYILKGKFKNISQKAFVRAEIYEEGARWTQGEIGNAHVLIGLNKNLYLVHKNGYGVLNVGFESPWRPSEEKVVSLYFKNQYPTYVLAAASGNLRSAHFQYEPTECTLVIPIYLEDAQGYKLQEYLRFNILEDYKEFGKELEN